MSEEQPSYKVTDRRLFNPDGSPREVPPEEQPEPKTVDTEAPTTVASQPEATSSTTAASPAVSAESEPEAQSQPEPIEAGEPAQRNKKPRNNRGDCPGFGVVWVC